MLFPIVSPAVPLDSQPQTFTVERVDRSVRRVARYGERVEETLLLRRGDEVVRIRLAGFHPRFVGRVTRFDVGDRVYVPAHSLNADRVDRRSLRRL